MAGGDDTQNLILSISADTRALVRAMKDAGVTVDQTTKAMVDDFPRVGQAADRAAQQVQASLERSGRATQQVVRNIGFQLNDVTQGLLSGTSPFTIMAQQTSQISQALDGLATTGTSKLQALGLALRGMLSWQTAITAAVILGTGYVVKYFEAWLSGGSQTDEEMQKHLDALNTINDKYGSLAPAAKAVIDQFMQQREVTKLTQELADSIGAIKTDSLDKLNAAYSRLNQVAAAAMDSPLFKDEAPQFINGVIDDWGALMTALKAGKQPVDEINALIQRLNDANLKDPNIGFDSLAKTLSDILPLLQTAADRTKAITELQKALGQAPDTAIQKQKEYNKAMEDMGRIADGPMSQVTKVLEDHAKALDNAQTEAEKYAADLKAINALDQLSIQGLDQLSSSISSAGSDFSKIVGQLESGGRNIGQHGGGTSASGMFGFTDETFIREMRNADERLRYASDASILSFKGSIEAQQKAFEQLTKDNSAALARAGVALTDTNRYLAHYLGAGGAIAAIRSPGMSMQALENAGQLARGTVAANNLQGKTAGQVIAEVNARVEAARRQVAPTSSEAQIDATERQTKALKAEEEAVGDLGNQIDETTYKREKARKMQELLNADEEKGITTTAEMRAEYEKQADAYAKVEAGRVGYNNALKAAKSLDEAIAGIQQRTQALHDEAEANGTLAASVDQLTYNKEKAKITAELMTVAQRDGNTVTAEEKARIDQTADAYANLAGKLKSAQGTRKATNRDMQQTVDQLASMSTGFVTGFISDLRDGKSATDALTDSLSKLADQLLQMALNQVFKSIFGAILGVPSTGGFSLFATAQQGGFVGATGHGRQISPFAFMGASRYASGGFVGLRAGEVPIIAHRGEYVLPTSAVQQAMRGGGGGTDTTSLVSTSLGDVNIDMSQTGLVAADNDSAKQFGINVQKMIQAEMVRESRPGGLLRKVPG